MVPFGEGRMQQVSHGCEALLSSSELLKALTLTSAKSSGVPELIFKLGSGMQSDTCIMPIIDHTVGVSLPGL